MMQGYSHAEDVGGSGTMGLQWGCVYSGEVAVVAVLSTLLLHLLLAHLPRCFTTGVNNLLGTWAKTLYPITE